MNAATLSLSLALSAGSAFGLSSAQVPAPGAADAMRRFVAAPNESHAYRASRRLEATGSGQQGWLEAQTDFTVAGGLQYEVTAEGGSGYIRSRVLRSLLEQERQLIANGDSSHVALSAANYTFTADGIADDGLARVAMQPKRKEKALIAGHLFVRPADGELMRVEGRLAKNPSFWITRVEIVRSYRRIDGALLPVLLESTAQLRLLGRSTLRMTYRYSEVDDRPVAGDDAPAGACCAP